MFYEKEDKSLIDVENVETTGEKCCHLLLLCGYYQSRFGLIPRSRGGRWGLIKATVCSKILQMFMRY